MRLSRPAFYSTLASCFAHSVALSFAATLIVSAPQPTSRPVQITLLQRATPLPIGEGVVTEKPHAVPSEKRQELVPAPQVQARPKPEPITKPKRQRPALPKTVRTLPPPPLPAVVQSAERQETPVQVAVNPAATTAAGTDGVSSVTADSATAGDDGETKSAKGNNSAQARSSRGGNPGVAAQPDYGVNPKPPYPMLARRLGAQGVVLLRVQVREDGTVATVELALSSGFAMLDESATRTVRESWRFVPARLDGAPVASWVEVPIRFVLEDS